LSNSATLNIWCDRQAEHARTYDLSDPNIDVYPAKKWALFSDSPVTQKITSSLNYNILQTLYHESLERFLHKKHGICDAMLKDINTDGLHIMMKKSKPHQRASLAKLIHRWIPTNAFTHTQSRTQTPLCPRCLTSEETAEHILTCPAKCVIESREKHVYQALKELEDLATSQIILHTFEQQLCTHMNITNKSLYE
jgi:hypothetical protein